MMSSNASSTWRHGSVTYSLVLVLMLATMCVSNCVAQDPVVDAPFVDKAIIAAELSLLAKQASPVNPDTGVYTYFDTVQDDGDNLAIVAKNNGDCYAAYRGRVPGFFEDLIQRFLALFSLNLDFFDNICFEDDCCKIRTPVQRDFESLNDEVEVLVDTCRETCGVSTPCPLILTGHQQGGAVAYAAGIQFSDADPIGFTFGSPKLFGGDCPVIDSTQWFRFVNSRESQYRMEIGEPQGGLIYDFVPLSYDDVPAKKYVFAKHLGYQLTLSFQYTIANIGLNANVDLRTVSAGAGDLTKDNPELIYAGYLDRLRFLRNYYTSEASYPVQIGYFQGNLCTIDAECVDGTECLKQCPVCPPRCNPRTLDG